MVTVKRGYDDPGLRQLSIFLHNRVGELADLLRHFESERITVHGLSIADSVDFAVLRIVVDKVDAARRILRDCNLSCSDNMILGVELPDERSGLLQVCRALIGAEINIHYVYSLMSRPHGRPGILIHVDDMGTAVEALTKRGFDLLFENDLQPPNLPGGQNVPEGF